MKLLWSPRSPYVRKVMIAAHETGVADRLDLVRLPASFAAVPTDELLAINPLGKIPALISEDGEAIYDSGVICFYLDGLHGGRRLVPAGEELWHLRWQALADGVLERLIGVQVEHMRPNGPWPVVIDAATAKIAASLDAAARDLHGLDARPFGLAALSLVAALGHLDFRFEDCGWRTRWPDLASWADRQDARASVAATRPRDEAGSAAPRVLLDLRR